MIAVNDNAAGKKDEEYLGGQMPGICSFLRLAKVLVLKSRQKKKNKENAVTRPLHCLMERVTEYASLVEVMQIRPDAGSGKHELFCD